jgi:hypothetical protein
MTEPADRNILWRRRATAAIAIALPLVALGFAAFDLVAAHDADALADGQERTVAALERRVARLGTVAGGAKTDVSAMYLPGAERELARAELQKLLTDRVEAVDGKLIESQEPGGDLADPDAADDGRVDLRVTFDAKNDGLLDLLYGLETGLPILTVQRLEARRVGDSDDAEDPTLRASLVVRGYRKTPS